MPYEICLAPAAERSFRKLDAQIRSRIVKALEKFATETDEFIRGGKRVKTIHGFTDSFHRLRVGDYRVMYDMIEKDNVILVLGIVHRSNLEKWLRSRS